MRKMAIFAALGLFGYALPGADTPAQQVRDGGDTAPLQAAIQQLTLERSELEARNTELEAELEAGSAELEGAEARIAVLESQVAELEASLQRASAAETRSDEQAAQLRSRLDELIAEFRATVEVLRTTELELNDTMAALASVESERDQCVVHNRALYETGIEVLERYEEKGCFESVGQREPFTQLKRVELENLVDGYRWRLEDELLPESSTPE